MIIHWVEIYRQNKKDRMLLTVDGGWVHEGSSYYPVRSCLKFSTIKFLKCHLPSSHTPHALPSYPFMTSTSATKLLTLQFQYLPQVFQQPKKSTNSATMLDIQMLHFGSTLLQELSFTTFLLSTIFQFFLLMLCPCFSLCSLHS